MQRFNKIRATVSDLQNFTAVGIHLRFPAVGRDKLHNALAGFNINAGQIRPLLQLQLRDLFGAVKQLIQSLGGYRRALDAFLGRGLNPVNIFLQ